jgi:hypothetical protein
MLPPMHPCGVSSADHQRAACRCGSADYVQRFWHHAVEIGRWWRSAVKSLICMKNNYFYSFRFSLIFDIVKGMLFISSSELKVHANLKSSNCLVDSRYVWKILFIKGTVSRDFRPSVFFIYQKQSHMIKYKQTAIFLVVYYTVSKISCLSCTGTW